MFTGNTINHTVNLFTHYLYQVKARLLFLMIEEPQQLLIGIPEYIGLFLIGLWAGKKDIFKRVPELLKHIIFLQWSSLCISCLLSCPIIYYFIKGCLLLLRYTTMDSIWRKMLAIFYICTLLRICENKNYREWLYPL